MLLEMHQNNILVKHMFLQCGKVTVFWEELVIWINLTLRQSLIFSDTHVPFIYYMETDNWMIEGFSVLL